MGSLTMTPGLIVGDRFEIENLVWQRGMSQVFRARELRTGQAVALDVLYPGNRPRDVERFLAEVEALRGLQHEGIAGYVAHGPLPQGQFYVATRWLVGEDLEQRLERQPLTVGESLLLVRKVAEALAVGHGRGVVHGELEPNKLLLQEGMVERVALLNFGITTGNLAARTLMGTGEIVAALRYLAPEQARGAERVDASADVYALGCILFECLTGRVLFAGEHAAVVLTRILHEEVPRLGQLCPELPASLETLLGRMLAQRPAARLVDGRALVEALQAVKVAPDLAGRVPAWNGPLEGGTRAGRRWVCAVLAMPPPVPREETAVDRGEEGVRELKGLLSPYGAEVDGLAGGAVMATLPEAWGATTDQAVLAARVALVLRQHLARWSVAVAIGKGAASGAQLMGEALQQAVELLRAEAETMAGPTAAPSPVWLDELTAGLLETRFHVRRMAGGKAPGWVLERERKGVEEVRTLLGRRTPYVGRERELDLLEIQLGACIEESVARTLVVMAPAGMGKSRLMEEFLRRVRDRAQGVEVLIGRGDPLRAGAAYGVLGQAIQEWCGLGVLVGDARRQAFVRQMGRWVPQGEGGQGLEFLGEVCGVPWPGGSGGSRGASGSEGSGGDEPSPQLRAARQDPRLMNDRVAAAWVEFLRSVCAAHPVLLVLEDLHWSDATTVRLVDVALQELGEARLMVLGLGRPEMKEQFPQLWHKHPVQELRLPELGRRASERLVREMLGAEASAETVRRIVEQAGGHALFLEELIRGALEGAGERLPETVQAMLEARFVRLGRLDPGARRLLEVASLMGETFFRGGVVELLAAERDAHREVEIDRWLRGLVETETIVRQGTSRFPEEVQYAFRHVLVRDAAYGLLSPEDRRLGHRLVGGYLERMGEQDLVVLAEHYRLGGEPAKAAEFFARAAVQAMDASDPAGALRSVAQGVACGATGTVLGTLRAVEAQAALWNSDLTTAYQAGTEALPLLDAGSAEWYRASGPLLSLVGALGREALFEQIRVFAAAAPLPGAECASVEPTLLALRQSCVLGLRTLSRSLLERMEDVCRGQGEREVRARGFMYLGRSWFHLLLDGDPGPAQGAAEAAMACLETVGDRRYHAVAQGNLGLARALLGDAEGALGACRAAIAALEGLKEATMLRMMQGQLALGLLEIGGPELAAEALTLADLVLDKTPQPTFWTGLGHGVRALVLADRGELPEAEAAARRALDAAAVAPAGHALASSIAGRVLLAQGEIDAARKVTEEALKLLATLGGASFVDVKLRLLAAQVFTAVGEPETAAKVLRAADRQILRRAAQLPEGARARFLALRDHERVRALLTVG